MSEYFRDIYEHPYVNTFDRIYSIDGTTIKTIIHEYADSIEITKSDSRKVLGNINDLIFQYSHMLLSCSMDLHNANIIPQRNIGWGCSKDAIYSIIEAKNKHATMQ